MVSMLAFFSDDPTSNPTEVYSFFSVKIFEKNKRGQGWAFLKTVEFLIFLVLIFLFDKLGQSTV